jgi:predicted DNA-binding transcriptional regulator YafY
MCSDSQLIAVVRDELADKHNRLSKLLLKVWRTQHREIFAQALVDSLNSGTSPESIEELIRAFGGGIPVIFSYTKEDGIAERRRIFVVGASKRSLHGFDQKDDKRKSFRLDRISAAEPDASLDWTTQGRNGCLAAVLVITGFLLAILRSLYIVR